MEKLRTQSAEIWKQKLQEDIPENWGTEIDQFETELYLKKQGKIEDRIFAETRLRRGAYGQRYDNGQRHDGKEQRKIPFPNDLTKGPNTVWDAPGMERIKIPYGGMNPEQMDVIADLAEEYSDGICHVTTRQDFQLHYVHIEDTPSMFRRLAAVGITTREACGNSIRNITACPIVGVCKTEAFDVTPYADAMFRFLLGHPDVQDFGRKFKIAFSGCKQNPCGLTNIHDMGLIATTREVSGETKRGFEFYVGGGLGAVPYQAKLLDEFVTEAELLPLTQAVCRIYARYGEKKKRSRSRIKFLVNDWGIDKFRQMVFEERPKLKEDSRWNDYLATIDHFQEKPFKAISAIPESHKNDANYQQWLENNVQAQKQAGYYIVTVALPLGDITSNQMRDLAEIVRRYVKDTVRTTVEQNIVIRWVSQEDLPLLYDDLKKVNLAEPVANTIIDITACPGTDTCKLGNASSRGLAGELRHHLAQKMTQMDQAVRGLKIKVSGCFNSCGQHHISDIGFYGISRKLGNRLVPHFQLVLGGQWSENGGSYGLAVGGIPSKAIPQTVDTLTEMYLLEKQSDESFKNYIARLGKVELKNRLNKLMEIPPYEQNASYYVDWGDVREFTTSDIGTGECAGEIVSLAEFGLKEADRQVFEAQVQFDAGETLKAAHTAYRAMIHAAQGLIKGYNPDISNDPEIILQEFKQHFCDTEKFYDPFAGDKFANYLFKTHDTDLATLNREQVRQQIEEAQLFIEAAYNCNVRMSMSNQPTH